MAIIGKTFKDGFGARGQPKTVVTDIPGKTIPKERQKNDKGLQFGLYNDDYLEVILKETGESRYITQANALKLAYWILDRCSKPHVKLAKQSERDKGSSSF